MEINVRTSVECGSKYKIEEVLKSIEAMSKAGFGKVVFHYDMDNDHIEIVTTSSETEEC